MCHVTCAPPLERGRCGHVTGPVTGRASRAAARRCPATAVLGAAGRLHPARARFVCVAPGRRRPLLLPQAASPPTAINSSPCLLLLALSPVLLLRFLSNQASIVPLLPLC